MSGASIQEKIRRCSALINEGPHEQDTLSSLYVVRGMLYLENSFDDAAIEDFTRALEADPNNKSVYALMCITHATVGNSQPALEACSSTIKYDPDNILAYYYRSKAHADLDNAMLATHDLSTVIDRQELIVERAKANPFGPAPSAEIESGVTEFLADVFKARAVIHLQEGRYELAIADYTEAINLKPENSNFYYERGIAYRAANQLRKAIEDLSHAITLNPDFGSAYLNRALAYDEIGEVGKAAADRSKAEALKP